MVDISDIPFDRSFFDDREAVAGQAHRCMVRVRQEDHVVNSERCEDLRAGPIPANRVATVDRLAGTDINLSRQRTCRCCVKCNDDA